MPPSIDAKKGFAGSVEFQPRIGQELGGHGRLPPVYGQHGPADHASAAAGSRPSRQATGSRRQAAAAPPSPAAGAHVSQSVRLAHMIARLHDCMAVHRGLCETTTTTTTNTCRRTSDARNVVNKLAPFHRQRRHIVLFWHRHMCRHRVPPVKTASRIKWFPSGSVPSLSW